MSQSTTTKAEIDFPCTGCGACCTKIGGLLDPKVKFEEPDRTLVEQFPYKAREDGSCEMFIDGKCSVYESRPVLCNIKERWRIYFSTQSWDEHMLEQKRGCDILQRRDRMDPSWRVKL